MVFCVLIGFGQGYQPAAGYNYGAKEYGRVKKAYRFMLWAGTGVMTVLGILLYAAAPWLLEPVSYTHLSLRPQKGSAL